MDIEYAEGLHADPQICLNPSFRTRNVCFELSTSQVNLDLIFTDGGISCSLLEKRVHAVFDVHDLLLLDSEVAELFIVIVVVGELGGLVALLARSASGSVISSAALAGLGGTWRAGSSSLLGSSSGGRSTGGISSFGLELALDLGEGDAGGTRSVLQCVSRAGHTSTWLRIVVTYTGELGKLVVVDL